MIKIDLSEILSYKNQAKRGDYSLGGFYMIKHKTTGMAYIGKSINVIKRLKQHHSLAISNRGIYIDQEMHGNIQNFEFYILSFYKDIGINFFNRKLETSYEQDYIFENKTFFPSGYNIRIYESIRTK